MQKLNRIRVIKALDGSELREARACLLYTSLRPGVVMTVEPGIYLTDEFGVRIEDMGVVTEQGFENFTKATKELIIL